MDERLNSCEMHLRLVGVLAGLPGSNSVQDRRLHCALHWMVVASRPWIGNLFSWSPAKSMKRSPLC